MFINKENLWPVHSEKEQDTKLYVSWWDICEVNVYRMDAGEQYENTWEKACVLSAKSCPTLCDLMDCNPSGSSVHEFSRQEYWSRLPSPPGDLPDPGVKSVSPKSPALVGRFFTTGQPGKPWENQFSSGSQSCLTLCDSMDCSTPGFPVHHQLLKFTQIHVRWVGDAIQPSHPLSSPSPPAFSLSQHQGLFKWVSSSHQVAKVLEFQLQHVLNGGS